jgi:hypothetical protein
MVIYNGKQKKFISLDNFIKARLTDFSDESCLDLSKQVSIADFKHYCIDQDNNISKKADIIYTGTHIKILKGALINLEDTSFYLKEEFEMSKRAIIDKEKADKIISLLNTPSKENKNMAIMILENSNLLESIHYVAYIINNYKIQSSVIMRYLRFFNNDVKLTHDLIIRTVSKITQDKEKTKILINNINYR